METASGTAAAATQLDAGMRRIVLQAPRGASATQGLTLLLSGQGGHTLVVTEFESLRHTLAEIRGALGKDAVSGLEDRARVTVGNYERVALHAGHMPADAFELVVLLPHRPENCRSAAAIAGRFASAAMLQVTRGGAAAFVPDHSATLADLPPPAAVQDNVAPFRVAS